MENAINLHSILDTNKLTKTNFLDWQRNLRIVLRHEKIEYVLEGPIPTPPGDDAQQHFLDNDIAKYIMLESMTTELHDMYVSMNAYTIIEHLKELYGARTERFDLSKALFSSRMTPGTSVNLHVLKMIKYIERLSKIGFPLRHELSIDLILHSLPDNYSHFVFNHYNINKVETTLPELLNMLKIVDTTVLDKGKHDHLPVHSCKDKALKAKVKAMKNTSDKGTCFHCGKIGHWLRNCKDYLESLKEKKHIDASTSTSTSVSSSKLFN